MRAPQCLQHQRRSGCCGCFPGQSPVGAAANTRTLKALAGPASESPRPRTALCPGLRHLFLPRPPSP